MGSVTDSAHLSSSAWSPKHTAVQKSYLCVYSCAPRLLSPQCLEYWVAPNKLSWGWVCRRNMIACALPSFDTFWQWFPSCGHGYWGTLHVAATCSLLPCYKSGRVQEPCAHGKCLFESHCFSGIFVVFSGTPGTGSSAPTRKEEKMRLAWKWKTKYSHRKKNNCEANLVVALFFSHLFPNCITSEILLHTKEPEYPDFNQVRWKAVFSLMTVM